jgi:hypothetical protein
MTPFERAKIRLEAFQLLDGWGTPGDPKAKDLCDRLIVPWDLKRRMQRAADLADWAMAQNDAIYDTPF